MNAAQQTAQRATPAAGLQENTVSAVTPDGRPCLVTAAPDGNVSHVWVPRIGDRMGERLDTLALCAREWMPWARREVARMGSADWAAVYGFIASLKGTTAQEAFANLRMDANGYGWNAATRTAIADGIGRHFAKPVSR